VGQVGFPDGVEKEGEIPQGGQGGQQPRCLLLIDSWHFGGTACCCFVADTMPSSDNIETAAGCAAGENGSLWPILQGANLNNVVSCSDVYMAWLPDSSVGILCPHGVLWVSAVGLLTMRNVAK
jgi:hypothetical protein